MSSLTSDVGSPSFIDPKSSEGAHAALTTYAELIAKKYWPEARGLWTDGSDPIAAEAQLRQFVQLKAEVGQPGSTEGAAGSIYIEVPLQLTGRTKSGEDISLAGMATLRRVNDVPGSTDVQRHWHIYRLDLQPRP